MLTEISLNILDIAQNSIRACAKLVEIIVSARTASDELTIIIKDDGHGMTDEQLNSVTDPFFTTRTTRKIGLGIPFYKMAAECTGGSFSIVSEKNKGTTVTAVFKISHIDRMPMGDINFTMFTLITLNPDIDFYFMYEINDRSFTLDTREFKSVLGNVPLNAPEVADYIKQYLDENKSEVDNGVFL